MSTSAVGLTVGSLFSGIGGLELGLECAGLGPVLWQVELDPYCRAVLAEHWPDATRYEDVHHVGGHNLEPVDIICGGFPCPPVSQAGKRLGRNDPRWLWPEFARIVRELRPRYVFVENVTGLLSLMDERGCSLAGDVLGDLAALGYDAEWRVLSAADAGAPQERERIWIVAYAGRGRLQRGDDARGSSGERRADAALGDASSGGRGAREGFNLRRTGGGCEAVGDASGGRRGHGGQPERSQLESASRPVACRSDALLRWDGATPIRGADGSVRLIPREAALAGPESPLWPVADGLPGRVARLRAIGNAVVPACAEVFGRLILEHWRSSSEDAA